MNTLMAELPVINLQPMKSSSWVGSPWFYVCLTLAVTITIGLCIKKRKTIKKVGWYMLLWLLDRLSKKG